MTIDEILRLVNIALGTASIDICPAGDVDGNGEITIDEIIAAVNAALTGCPSALPTATATSAILVPTSTATATDTPGVSVPSPTNTVGSSGSLGRNAAHTVPLLARSLTTIPALLSSITQIASGGAGLSARRTDAQKPCSGGGTLDFTCTQTTPRVSPRDYAVSFSACRLAAGAGDVLLNGSVTARSTEVGLLATCALPPLELSSLTATGVDVTLHDGGAVEIEHASFNVSGSLKATADLASSCRIGALDLTLTGSVVTTASSEVTTMTFESTRLRLQIDQFSTDCVPVAYRLTVDGPLSLVGDAIRGTFQSTVSGVVMQVAQSNGGLDVALSGNASADCLGGSAMLSTLANVHFTATAACPDAGAVLVTAGGTTRVTFATDEVDIDRGNDGSIDEILTSCQGLLCE